MIQNKKAGITDSKLVQIILVALFIAAAIILLIMGNDKAEAALSSVTNFFRFS